MGLTAVQTALWALMLLTAGRFDCAPVNGTIDIVASDGTVTIAQSAVQDPDTYTDKITQAQSLMRDALNGIRALHATNTVNDTVMQASNLAHQTQINVNTDGTSKIEGVDQNEVAAKIQTAQIQLQAVFSSVGTSGRLSLVNFLT